jgi:hypothetical protein
MNMATEEEKKAKTLTDPYADIRDLLYRQKPETREAEMRAEKNRAKATAFLQAFGTIADAFTLSRGGDVPKRDLNPYIMNSMQKADAMREQDRADRKAWDSSLLNLENNVAQYNIRQREIAKQQAFQKERDKEQFERELTKQEFENDEYSRRKEYEQDLKELEWKNKYGLEGLRYNLRALLDGSRAEAAESLENLRQQHRRRRDEYLQKGREIIAVIKAGQSGNKPFMSIVNPENPAEMIPVDESVANLLFGLMLRDRYDDDDISGLIPYKEGAYTRDEAKRYIEVVAREYPEKIMEYLGELYPTVIQQTQPVTPPAPTVPAPTVPAAPATPAGTNAQTFVGPPPPPAQTQKKQESVQNIANKFK